MSVLNKKPYINKVLEALSEENQVKLGNLLNGSGDRTELKRILGLPSGNRTPITEADKGVHICSLQIGPTVYSGYLLYTDEDCALVWFTDFQTIAMFAINVEKQEFATVSEYLDINELRGSLNDLLIESGHAVKVQADDIDSGTETAGKVLIADGSGGAEWGEASGGGSGDSPIYVIDKTVNYGDGTCTVQDIINTIGDDFENGKTFMLFFTDARSGILENKIAYFQSSYGTYSISQDMGLVLKQLTTSNANTYIYAMESSYVKATQLYKHELTIDGTSGYCLYTTDNTDLTNIDAGSSSFVPYFKEALKFSDGQGRTICYVEYQGIKNVAYVIGGSSISTIEWTSETLIADTVTPL